MWKEYKYVYSYFDHFLGKQYIKASFAILLTVKNVTKIFSRFPWLTINQKDPKGQIVICCSSLDANLFYPMSGIFLWYHLVATLGHLAKNRNFFALFSISPKNETETFFLFCYSNKWFTEKRNNRFGQIPIFNDVSVAFSVAVETIKITHHVRRS